MVVADVDPFRERPRMSLEIFFAISSPLTRRRGRLIDRAGGCLSGGGAWRALSRSRSRGHLYTDVIPDSRDSG
jgi:hypothetical protein